MKKAGLLLICTAFLCLNETRVEAGTVEYTKKKHETLLSQVSKFTTMHYGEYKRSFFPKIPKTATYDSYLINGEQKLVKIASIMKLREKKLPAEKMVFDYAAGKVYGMNDGGVPAMRQLKEKLLMEQFPAEDKNLKEVVLRIFDEYQIKPGLKGESAGKRETYKFKIDRLKWVPAADLKSCDVVFTIKKKGKTYVPESIKVDLRADMIMKNVLTKSFIKFKGFNNKKIVKPAN